MPASSFKLPKSPAACADLLFSTRKKRLAMQKEVDKLQEAETALNEYFRKNLPKGTTGVAGKLARVQTDKKSIPRVADWDAFWKGFNVKRDKDLLQRRLSDAAVQERWDAKKVIPGVEKFNLVTVHVTALKGGK
jgi:hypothetical protein